MLQEMEDSTTEYEKATFVEKNQMEMLFELTTSMTIGATLITPLQTISKI